MHTELEQIFSAIVWETSALELDMIETRSRKSVVSPSMSTYGFALLWRRHKTCRCHNELGLLFKCVINKLSQPTHFYTRLHIFIISLSKAVAFLRNYLLYTNTGEMCDFLLPFKSWQEVSILCVCSVGSSSCHNMFRGSLIWWRKKAIFFHC